MPIAPLVVLGFVVILIAAVGYGAYVYLPTASITLRPIARPIDAAPFSVTADPNMAVVDINSGMIPAERLTVPIHVEGTFAATGIDIHDTRAAGSVRFKSENTVSAVTIPANTVVSTTDGIEFVTGQDVVVPTASFATGPTKADVDVRAVKGGTKGNVDANTITVLPAALAAQVVSVTNPDPTTGGKHVEDQVISQEDYDAAVTALSDQMEAALLTALVDPRSVPRGLTAYAATAQISAGQPDQPASSLVGTAASSFNLALDATADVTAVDESQIDQVGEARVRAALLTGQQLVGDEVSVTYDRGTAVDETVVYSVTASGMGYTNPEPQTLVEAIRGLSVADAQTELGSFGTVEIDLWPQFVDHLPDQTSRISVNVIAPTPLPIGSPLPAGSPLLGPEAS